ncbi:MAG TPA: MFS transporter [Thermomicrobiales bacterium]|jgi:MFS family permease|nr:MFS transporter [Thermomicrobiales bacterium]
MAEPGFGPPSGIASRRDKAGIIALLSANAISLTGNQVTMFALPWFVLETTDSAAQTALVAATQMAAFLLAAVAGGVVVDRFGPKWLSVVSDLASGLSIAAIPILMHTIGLRLWQVLVLAFLGAILDSPGGNARYGIVTDLIDLTGWRPERVYSAFSSADGVARIFGPILAGGLIAWIGAVNALWVDAASFAVSALLITVLVPLTTRPLRPESTFMGDVQAGWEYLRSRALLIRFFSLIVCVNLTAVPLAAVVIPKIAHDHYGSSRIGGVMLAADGIGVILGGLVFGIIGRRLTAYRSMLVALVLLFLSMLLLSGLFPVPISVAALALTGIGFGVMVPNNQTVFRRITDVEFRGRLLGLRDAVVGISSPMMVVIVGLLLDLSPVRLVIMLLALINLGVVIWYLRESVFAQLNAHEPVQELVVQAR